MAVRAARTHLRTIRRQPAHFQALPHAHFDEQLAQQQHALSSEACDFDLDVFEVMGVFRFGSIVPRFRSDLKHIGYRALRRLIARGNFRPAVAENIQRKGWHHLLENPAPRFHRILAPNRRTRRQDFDKREARAVALDLERFADRPPRFHDVLVVRKRHAFDVCRRFQRGEKFRHVQREAFIRRPPSPGRSRALLPDQGGGRHLSAGHAVDSVVHEKDSDLFAAVGGMHDLGGADGRQVAVSLIGNDDLVRDRIV